MGMVGSSGAAGSARLTNDTSGRSSLFGEATVRRRARESDDVAAAWAEASDLASLLEARGVLPNTAKDVAVVAVEAGVERAQLRSILWNLSRNLEMLKDVNRGAISGAQLVAMHHEELAEASVKRRRQQLKS